MLDDGLIDSEYIETNYKNHIELLDQSLIAADPMNYTVPELEMERGWDKMSWDRPGELEQVETGFDLEKLKEIGSK